MTKWLVKYDYKDENGYIFWGCKELFIGDEKAKTRYADKLRNQGCFFIEFEEIGNLEI